MVFQISILVKPGKYSITSSLLVDKERMVDIVGDISEGQEPSEVTFCING